MSSNQYNYGTRRHANTTAEQDLALLAQLRRHRIAARAALALSAIALVGAFLIHAGNIADDVHEQRPTAPQEIQETP